MKEAPKQQAKGKTPEKIGKYCVEEIIGKGSFGKVRMGVHVPTGEKVAIKILKKEKVKAKSDLLRVQREIRILKKIRHPNVLHLYEVP